MLKEGSGTPIQVVLYEGTGSTELSEDARFEVMAALLDKGYAVARSGVGARSGGVDEEPLLVLGDFGGDAPRDSEVWTSDDPLETGGPLVIVWHSFDGTPLDAIDILGQDVVDAVMAQGGAIVAPYPDVNAGFSV